MGGKGRRAGFEIGKSLAQIAARHQRAQTAKRAADGQRLGLGHHLTRGAKEDEHPIAGTGVRGQRQIDQLGKRSTSASRSAPITQ